MKHAAVFVLSAILAGAVSATVLAHETTYKGTVVSVETGKNSQIKVSVVNTETKKATEMVFGIDDETRILRGDVVVKFADARIAKGEPISVTLNIDDGNTMADVIRLPVRK